MLGHKGKINKEAIVFAVILAPFFEPMLFGLLEEKGLNTQLWSSIGMIFLLMRILFVCGSFALLLLFISRGEIHFSKVATFLMINILLWGVSSIFSQSADLKLWVNVVQNAGFIIVCTVLTKYSRKHFFQGCILLFGILTFLGIVSILLHPMGYFHAASTNEAFYFLGGKNGSFPYYYSFFFSAIVYSVVWKCSNRKLYLWLGLCLLAALICQSSNSLICLTIIVICLALYNSHINISFLHPKILGVVFILIFVLIYTGNISAPVVSVLNKMGRDITFSGRDVLWAQAFGYILAEPLWGVGNKAVFILRDLRNAGHAHSQYLNRLAIYGIVPFVFFLLSVICLFKKGDSVNKGQEVIIIELLMLVYFLHMGFDTYPYYFIILMLIGANEAFNELIIKDRNN